jgi:uncharacterized protein YecT (DUF1311 family)
MPVSRILARGRPPGRAEETTMHPNLSYYLARARRHHQNVSPNKPTGSIRPLMSRTAPLVLITATLCVLAVGVLAPRASAREAVRTASAGAVAFVPIVEPFDPGHPARTEPNPGNCYAQKSTVGIEQCFDVKTENTDTRIDAARLARFRHSTTAAQIAINAQDRSWLAVRVRVCKAVYHTGGTIDIIDIATCQLDESTARLHSVTGTGAPKATLPQTDSIDLSQLAYYTTPGGARIAEIDTQGDETGGGIVAWVIIGGYQGFTVNPARFSYQDGSFTDAGVVQPPNPRWHRVAPGAVYQFSIDYSTISHDPHACKGTGGYVYAPGGHVRAEWTGR